TPINCSGMTIGPVQYGQTAAPADLSVIRWAPQEGLIHTAMFSSAPVTPGSNATQGSFVYSFFNGSSVCTGSSSSSSVYELPQYSQVIFCVLLSNFSPAEQFGHL